jgi:putative aldouronate transport system substrate-binding protein
MIKRKVVSMLLVGALSVSLLAGCAGEKSSADKTDAAATTSAQSSEASATNAGADEQKYGDTGGLKLPITDKPVKISWTLASDVQNINDSPIIKELEKRTGVTLDIQAIPTASFGDKMSILMASGKLTDIAMGVAIRGIGSEGALAAINKSIDLLPNFKKLYVDENPWVMKTYADDKGDIYTWPVYGLNRDVNHGFLYRKDIFDKKGIKEWTNLDEFYQALKKLKEIYPKSYPYASKDPNILKNWSYEWGLGGETFPVYYDENAKTWKLATVQPEFKEMITFMKKLYDEGLIDPEFMTDTAESWTAKMTTDEKAFVTWDWIGRLDMFYNQVKDKNPEYNLRYANPIGPTGKREALSKILNYSIGVADNERKEISLKLLDYLTSPSGAELMTVGVKDVQYALDADGKIVYPELKDVPKVDINTLESKYGMWAQSLYTRVDRRSVYFNYTEKEQEAQDKIVKENKFQPIDPILRFTDDQSSQISEIRTAIDKAGKEFAAKYIMTKSAGDADWNEWVTKTEKLGSQKLLDIYNAAQAEFDKN